MLTPAIFDMIMWSFVNVSNNPSLIPLILKLMVFLSSQPIEFKASDGQADLLARGQSCRDQPVAKVIDNGTT